MSARVGNKADNGSPSTCTPEPSIVGHKVPGVHCYDGILYSSGMPDAVLDKVKRFELRDDDVLITAYPKSGQAWLMQMVSLIQHGGEIKTLREDQLRKKIPFLEIWIPSMPTPIVDVVASTPSPRTIKTHLGAYFFAKQLQTKKPKMIILMRNVKDVLVSFYHFHRMTFAFGPFTGPWDEFFEYHREGRLCFGDWASWNTGWWNYKDTPNFLFLKYEDMILDHSGTVSTLATFLGKTLDEQTIKDIVDATSFNEMKKVYDNDESLNSEFDQSISTYIRKGQVGDWKNYFSEEQSKFCDKECEELWRNTGLKFTFEL